MRQELGTVYRPNTPSDRANSLTGTEHSDGSDKCYRFCVPLTTILRTILCTILTAFTIADIAIWIAHSPFLLHQHRELVFGHVWLWLILFWNIGHVLYPLLSKLYGGGSGSRGSKGAPFLPTIALQVGDCACVFNDNNDDDDDDEGDGDGGKKKKRRKYGVSWAVDIILGIVPVVIAFTQLQWLYYWRNFVTEVMVLSHVVGVLSIFIGLFSPLTARRPVIFEMGLVIKNKDEEAGQYRIRLPVDTNNDRRTAGGIVSVSA
ncbi:hypothetical protein QBC36DRAFT_297749 [Triangularia setosa]|uniref:Uncharacterized protein n=1 Tax=Triangularia setosa TaxID=2587417 RepID=A0AAN7A9H3_9PEZI|nr:hypothetical protein QBC36DRAFT_297749 [Podospora setosa]